MPKIERRLARIEAQYPKMYKVDAPPFSNEDLILVRDFFAQSGNDINIQPPDSFSKIQREMLAAYIEFKVYCG